ncbi:hypothetical protein Y1Q_0019251 [Alligator mississippiensis]|uniref:Uncharacterized protein n=1 Tax=Alligator mississippiensis TaxID=8496 RepID=A0A151MQQ4_ALLMI|nr:hypothetical protein Y1Q_0019251 [Alligator mississippiensis]
MNTSILSRANTISFEATFIQHQLHWTGHIIRTPDNQLPNESCIPSSPVATAVEDPNIKDKSEAAIVSYSSVSSNLQRKKTSQ